MTQHKKKLLNFDFGLIYTFGSMLSKGALPLVITPIMVGLLPSSDLVVWFLYLSTLSLIRMADFGMSPTFIRFVSYVNSGEKASPVGGGECLSALSLSDAYHLMRSKYLKVSIYTLFLAFLIGFPFIYNPILNSTSVILSFFGWFLVVAFSAFSVFLNYLVSFYMGIGRVAEVQFSQMIINVFVGVATVCVAILSQNIVITVFIYLLSFPLSALVIFLKFCPDYNSSVSFPAEVVFKKFTSSQTLKSGFGLVISTGLIEFSGVVGANFLASEVSSIYQFSLQLMRSVNGFSHAPFTSKIPWFSSLFIQGRFCELTNGVKNSMRMCYGIFFLGFYFVLLVLVFFKGVIPNGKAPSIELWLLLGWAFFMERVGSLHIQFYSLTNNIVWHLVNGFSGCGVIFLYFITIYFRVIPAVYCFPFAMLMSYFFIFVPLAVSYSSHHYNFNPVVFDRTVVVPFLIVFGCITMTIVFL